MKQVNTLLLALFFSSLLTAQEIYFTIPYSSLPAQPRVTHSGIYSVSSFIVSQNSVSFNFFDGSSVVSFKKNEQTFIPADESLTVINELRSEISSETKIVCDYKNGASFYKGSAGNYSVNGSGLSVSVPDASRLLLTTDGLTRTFTFPGNLACADIIGRTGEGEIYLIAETYRQGSALTVDRSVMIISTTGKVLNQFLIPEYRYLSTIREFFADANGDLYQLLSGENELTVLVFRHNKLISGAPVTYPNKFNVPLRQNSFLPKDEAVVTTPKQPLAPASRNVAVRMGETYVLHRYQCSAANLAPSGVTAPDNDVVQTPSWLIKGANGRVAYKWGGFNTLAEYTVGLANGKYAGDINTNGVSSYSVGVDCSGFVSRCWQLTYHSSTADMPGITTQYPSWDKLKPGDAIHKVGHVRLFINRLANGMLRVVESSARDWGVSYWTYTVSELADYTPRSLNTMQTDYTMLQPKLTKAQLTTDNSVSLSWTCDTTGLAGYRIYESTSGVAWVLKADETTVRTNTAVVTLSNPFAYYRIAAVSTEAGITTEGNFSNILVTGKSTGTEKVLIVDAYDRENGSYRGGMYPYLMYYAKALSAKQKQFNSVKSTELSPELLAEYSAVYFCLADESSENTVISSSEQNMLKQYLQGGGKLFISGSEIGWGLSARGTAADKDFYEKYLHARYKADNAASKFVSGAQGTPFAGVQFQMGQMYDEDYPDEIDTINNSVAIFRYGNNKIAGVCYSGVFEQTGLPGKVIYLAFPLETTANDTAFTKVIDISTQFFAGLTGIEAVTDIAKSTAQILLYPNPAVTSVSVTLRNVTTEKIRMSIYSVTGEKVKEFTVRQEGANTTCVLSCSGLSAGVYIVKATGFADEYICKPVKLVISK